MLVKPGIFQMSFWTKSLVTRAEVEVVKGNQAGRQAGEQLGSSSPGLRERRLNASLGLIPVNQ